MSPVREPAVGSIMILAGGLAQIVVDVKPDLGIEGGQFVAIISVYETLCPPFTEVRANRVNPFPRSNGFEVRHREFDDGGDILQYTQVKVFSPYIV